MDAAGDSGKQTLRGPVWRVPTPRDTVLGLPSETVPVAWESVCARTRTEPSRSVRRLSGSVPPFARSQVSRRRAIRGASGFVLPPPR